MTGEKYIVATTDNALQIAVRNYLNPNGYTFLGNCSDAITLMRMIRSVHPDFIVVDVATQQSDTRNILETVDDEMLCACILLGEYKLTGIFSLVEKSKTISYCPKPLNMEVFLHTVELANINYRRVFGLDRKLKEMAESYESRKMVERAKWVLMSRDGLSEKEAYERMRKKSMDGRMSMKTIAESILYANDVMKKADS